MRGRHVRQSLRRRGYTRRQNDRLRRICVIRVPRKPAGLSAAYKERRGGEAYVRGRDAPHGVLRSLLRRGRRAVERLAFDTPFNEEFPQPRGKQARERSVRGCRAYGRAQYSGDGFKRRQTHRGDGARRKIQRI